MSLAFPSVLSIFMDQMEWSFSRESFRKRGIPSEVVLFSRFTGIIRISLYHLVRHTNIKLLNEIVDCLFVCLFVRIPSEKDRRHLTSHRTKRFFQRNG